MPIATSTIIITGAAVGLTGAATHNRKHWLPGRKRRLVALLMDEDSNESPAADVSPSKQAGMVHHALRNLDNAYQALFQNHIDPFLLGSNQQGANLERLQHQSLEEAREEYRINVHLGMSLLAAVTATLGTLGSPVLLGVSVGLSIYYSTDLFKKSYKHIVKEHRASDEVVISLAFIGALASGLYIINAASEVFYYLGEKLLIITQNRARNQMVDSWAQLPRSVWRIEDGAEVEVAVVDLQAGDTVVVHAGQVIPVDGLVVDGMGLSDQHMLTGESQPVEKQVGDEVFAATLLFSGKLHIRVKETGMDTVALQITEILNNTVSHEAQQNVQSRAWADRWAPVSLGLGAAAGATVGTGGMIAIWNAALGSNAKITAPIALMNFLNAAMQMGILVKDGRSMDLLQDVDTVVFDKTGTLTLEQPTVCALHCFEEITPEMLLTLAAAAEQRQAHPIAHAITQAAAEMQLPVPAVDDTHYDVGFGVQVMVDSHKIQFGSRRYMHMCGVRLNEDSEAIQIASDANGHSLVYLAVDGVLTGLIELQPTIRPEAAAVIHQLRQRGLDICIISGDQEEPTRQLATQLEIPHYFANTLPDNKAEIVERLQAEGRSVCFIGDGINDGIALKTAHVSVSLRGSTTVAIDAAQILLLSHNMEALPTLFDLAGDYHSNKQAGYLATVAPGLVFVGSVFMAGLGAYSALMVYNASLLLGIGISMAPNRRLMPAESQSVPAPTYRKTLKG